MKLSSNNNIANQCKTINVYLGINNNKSNNNHWLFKDSKVINKVYNVSSNVSNNDNITDNNNNNNDNRKKNSNNIDNNNYNNNNANDNNNGNDNNDNSNSNNINENDNNFATNDYEKSNHNNTNNKTANNKNKSNFRINRRKKSVYIVRDSMVKEVNSFELPKSMRHKYSVRVRFNPSVKTSCVNDHVKPIIRNQMADRKTLHTGTNDLSSDKTPA